MTTDPIAAARAMLEELARPSHISALGYLQVTRELNTMVATLADALEAERAKVAAAYEAAAEIVALDHVCDAIRALTPADAQAALDKLLAEARAMETKRADNLMRERDDALMRLGSLTEHLARLAEAKDHADGEPETDFDRGYDQAGDEIAAMIRDTEHNAQIIVGEMLAEARLEGWRAGRDVAADEAATYDCSGGSDDFTWGFHSGYRDAVQQIVEGIREVPEPKEATYG